MLIPLLAALSIATAAPPTYITPPLAQRPEVTDACVFATTILAELTEISSKPSIGALSTTNLPTQVVTTMIDMAPIADDTAPGKTVVEKVDTPAVDVLPLGPANPPKAWQAPLLKAARALIGTPYKWGGNTPDEGLDCSGYVRWVYMQVVGKHLPRVSADQSRVGKPVDRAHLKPGDLVFFDTEDAGMVTHVGLYVGNGVFLNAPRTGAKVRYESLASEFWTARWKGARRIL